MNRIDLYDNYLLGRLSNEEKALVQEKISSDPEFAKDLKEHEKVINLIKIHEDNRLRRKFAELDEGQIKHISRQRKVYMQVFSAAAAVALILVSYFTFFNPARSDFDNNEIASTLPHVHEYFAPPINYYIQRSRGRSVENKISDAMLFYDAGQYKQAAVLFDEILPLDTTNVNLLFFGGVSYLMSNQPDKAIDCFIRTEKRENTFEQEIKWYKSLIYLDTGKAEKATDLLNEIVDSGSKYEPDAKKILNSLK